MQLIPRRRYRKLSPYISRRQTKHRQRGDRLTILKVKLIDFIYANLLKGALAVLLFMSFLFFWYSRDLPSPDKIQ